MSSRAIAEKLVLWRRGWVTLTPLLWVACGGSAPPPAANPLDEVPAAAPAAAVPSSPEEVEMKKNKFDEEQARIVLARAATGAHTCIDVVDKDQPHGDATVIVTFSGVGKSTKASMATPFDNTPIGNCAVRAFVNIIVPPFEGPDVELLQQVNLKPDEKKGGGAAGPASKKPAPAKISSSSRGLLTCKQPHGCRSGKPEILLSNFG